MTKKLNELNTGSISSAQRYSYEPDDAQLTAVQIEIIKRLSGTSQDMPMTSSMFDLDSKLARSQKDS